MRMVTKSPCTGASSISVNTSDSPNIPWSQVHHSQALDTMLTGRRNGGKNGGPQSLLPSCGPGVYSDQVHDDEEEISMGYNFGNNRRMKVNSQHGDQKGPQAFPKKLTPILSQQVPMVLIDHSSFDETSQSHVNIKSSARNTSHNYEANENDSCAGVMNSSNATKKKWKRRKMRWRRWPQKQFGNKKTPPPPPPPPVSTPPKKKAAPSYRNTTKQSYSLSFIERERQKQSPRGVAALFDDLSSLNDSSCQVSKSKNSLSHGQSSRTIHSGDTPQQSNCRERGQPYVLGQSYLNVSNRSGLLPPVIHELGEEEEPQSNDDVADPILFLSQNQSKGTLVSKANQDLDMHTANDRRKSMTKEGDAVSASSILRDLGVIIDSDELNASGISGVKNANSLDAMDQVGFDPSKMKQTPLRKVRSSRKKESIGKPFASIGATGPISPIPPPPPPPIGTPPGLKVASSSSFEEAKNLNLLHVENNLRAIHEVAAEHLKHGEYAEALNVFEEILRGQIERCGPKSARVGTALHNISIVHLKIRNYTKAVESCREAIQVKKEVMGDDHPDVAVSFAHLGITHLECRQLQESLEAFREALRIRRKFLGYKHARVAKLLNNIGCVLFELDECAAAKLAFDEALDIQRKHMLGECGANQSKDAANRALLSIAATQCNIASIYLRCGEYTDATHVLDEALLVQQSVLGDNHVTVKNTLRSIEFVELTKGKHSCDRTSSITTQGSISSAGCSDLQESETTNDINRAFTQIISDKNGWKFPKINWSKLHSKTNNSFQIAKADSLFVESSCGAMGEVEAGIDRIGTWSFPSRNDSDMLCRDVQQGAGTRKETCRDELNWI